MAAWAANHWAVMEQAKPTTPSNTSRPQQRRITPVSPWLMPTLMISATTKGTSKSNSASSSLNSGARMLCLQKPSKYRSRPRCFFSFMGNAPFFSPFYYNTPLDKCNSLN